MIKFKFEIGQEVYYMNNNQIESSIVRVRKYEEGTNIKIDYTLTNGSCREDKLFQSPRELAESLLVC